ncbi:MAG: hypothetical protein P1P89_21455 [Desulfobacterales bacterium]|nr:hypothetical protein [Desulfobacterales bacterium]
MKKTKYSLKRISPRELFMHAAFRTLRLKLKQIRVITKVVNHLLVVWHMINLTRTRAALRRLSHEKKQFPYEDYPAYM